MKKVITGFFYQLKETKIVANFLNLSSIQLSNALLLILIYPIITRIIGIENFGLVMLANTYAGLAAIVINYGTNQSGIRDVAIHIKNPHALNKVISNTLWIRGLIFTGFLIVLLILSWAEIRYYNYVALALPIILAEVFNPLFIFLGAEKLKFYNVANLVSKVIVISLIVLLIRSKEDAEWVNFIMGTVGTLTYITLLIFAAKEIKLSFHFPQRRELIKIAKENFYLTVNNGSVHLQQSFMIFVLAKWGNPAWLGAYSLCDKIIWSSRILIISVSNAIYPKGAQLFQEGRQKWIAYRDQMKKVVAAVFFLLSAGLFILPGFVIQLLSGEQNQTAADFLRLMAIVPTLSALNSLNVLDLLLKNDTRSIFRIALILLAISACTAWILVSSGWVQGFGLYTVLIEGCALLMYGAVIKKSERTHD